MHERIGDAAWQADQAFLQRIARGLLRDVHEAEDLTQEVWLASLRKDASRSPSRNFLVGLARNLAVDRYRRRSRRFDVERGQSLPEGVPAPVALLERESNRQLVASAVAGLREPYRTAIRLRFFQELGAHAIAGRIGVPVETVRTRIKRGLAQLEEELERRSGERGDANWQARKKIENGARLEPGVPG